jgi:hypothetical protein
VDRCYRPEPFPSDRHRVEYLFGLYQKLTAPLEAGAQGTEGASGGMKAGLPELPPGESAYDKALPILRKAWARNRKLPRDLASNPKYMEGFGE